MGREDFDRYFSFNPRSRKGNDTFYGGVGNKYFVSIHAPARGTTADSCLPRDLGCFNPRSRKGNDRTPSLLYFSAIVSIHAPARGTTPDLHPNGVHRGFQSTLPQGERRFTAFLIFNYTMVSIHAPARGTTERFQGGKRDMASFNPRSRKGNDKKQRRFILHSQAFQSTLPQGERRHSGSPGTAA